MEQIDICKMTLLCVDDDPHTRKMIAGFLPTTYPHHDLLVAANAVDALECIRKYNPDIFIVGLDMSVLDHTVITQEIKMLGKENHSVGMSKCIDGDSKKKHHQTGIRFHLEKPVNFLELFTRLDEIMESVLVTKLETARTSIHNPTP